VKYLGDYPVLWEGGTPNEDGTNFSEKGWEILIEAVNVVSRAVSLNRPEMPNRAERRKAQRLNKRVRV
jgi:hypothetical protein